jgi:short-subunit dehydrogenase
MSSMGGRLVFPGFGYYHATKYAVEALSDALRCEVRNFGVKVVLIEPGLVKSGFADAANASLRIEGEVEQTYAAFHAGIEKSTRESYEKGPFAALAGVPDDVAKVVERALTVKRPKTRYTVTLSAKLLLANKALLSDRGWDWFVGMSVSPPAATV